MTLLEYLDERSDVSSANLSDVLDSLGVLHPEIKPMVPNMRVVGSAFTVKAYPGSILTVHKALLEAPAGALLVVDGEGAVAAGALLGELMALECQTKGFVGVVIDGAVRDVAGLTDLGFPVFARGVTPRVGTNKRIGMLRVPIACGGVVVHPGDVVLADQNGVVVVPKGRQAEASAKLEELLSKERDLERGIRQGRSVADMLGFAPMLRGDA